MDKFEEAAVSKWIQVAKGTLPDHGSANCTLCQVYQVDEECQYLCADENEDPCPIEKAGFPGCNGSPYNYWAAHIRKHNDHNHIVRCRDCQTLALIEMLFVYDSVMGFAPKWPTGECLYSDVSFETRLTFKDVGAEEIV
jgi:hypothetical protein